MGAMHALSSSLEEKSEKCMLTNEIIINRGRRLGSDGLYAFVIMFSPQMAFGHEH